MPVKPRPCVLTAILALTLVLCVSSMCATQAVAADDAGRKKAEAACLACHGPEGNKPITPETPRLGGQHYGYLVQALNDYRNGTRDNPVMSAMAKPLSEKEISELAEYYARQQGLTTKR